MSATEGTKLFKEILSNEDLPSTTSFMSVAHRLNNKILKCREMPSAEADFALQQLPYFISSRQFLNVPLGHSSRKLNVPADARDAPAPAPALAVDGDGAATEAVEANLWDKHFKDTAERLEKNEATRSFWRFVEATNKGKVPVFRGGSPLHVHIDDVTGARVIVNEQCARILVMMYRPCMRSVQDALLRLQHSGDRFVQTEVAPHATFALALDALLQLRTTALDASAWAQWPWPPGLERAYKRAVDTWVVKTDGGTIDAMRAAPVPKPRRRKPLPGDPRVGQAPVSQPDSQGEVPDNALFDVWQNEDNAYADDDGALELGHLAADFCVFADGERVGLDDAQRASYPENAGEVLADSIAEFNKRAATFSLPTRVVLPQVGAAVGAAPAVSFVDPATSIDNVGQRALLCAFMEFLLELDEWEKEPEQDRAHMAPRFRAIVAGVAGTGKSYCMQIIASCCSMFTAKPTACEVVAPTGGTRNASLWIDVVFLQFSHLVMLNSLSVFLIVCHSCCRDSGWCDCGSGVQFFAQRGAPRANQRRREA